MSLQRIISEERAAAEQRVRQRVLSEDKPDRSTLEAISRGNRYETVTVLEGWERQIREASYYWSDEERKAYSAHNCRETQRFLQAVVNNDQALFRELYDQTETRAYYNERDPGLARALTSGAGATGAVTAGFSQMLSLLENRTCKMKTVCTRITTDQNTCEIPKISQSPIAAFYGEGASMSGGTDTNVTKLTATPEKLGSVTLMSRELLEDSPLMLSKVISQAVAESIGDRIDYHVCHATPTNFTSNLGDDATASADTWVDASETLALIASKIYELPLDRIANATLIINPVAAAALAAVTGNDRQVFLPFNPAPQVIGEAEGGFGRVLVRCLVLPITTIPSNTAFIGDMSAYYLVERQPLRVELDRGAAFTTDQVGLHVSTRIDGVLTQATAVRKYPAA